MNQTTSQVIATLLVGAEGASEIEGQSWVRTAIDVEKQEFIFRACKGSQDKYRNSLVDGTGRPYFLLTVLDTAPDEVKAKAMSFARCLRLTN